MKGAAILAALLLLAVSCASLFAQPEAPSTPGPVDAGACVCPAVGAELREVQVERDKCEAALKDAEAPEVKMRTVVVQAQPRKCGGAGPDLVPVRTTRCQKGLVCLDTAGQAALAANELAWRTWLRKVQDCEAQP